MSEEEPRSAPVEEDPNKIDVKVVSQDGQEVYFKINKKTTLRVRRGVCGVSRVGVVCFFSPFFSQKLMDAYQARVGKAANQVRFLYDGER